MKLESQLKAAFSRELHRHVPHFVMLHYVTAGAPDREIVGNGVSSRWEFKHCVPDFDCPGNQQLVCMRLEAQGHCRFVLWKEDRDGNNKRTLIVRPKHIHDKSYLPEVWCVGYDHTWLVNQVKKVHGL